MQELYTNRLVKYRIYSAPLYSIKGEIYALLQTILDSVYTIFAIIFKNYTIFKTEKEQLNEISFA